MQNKIANVARRPLVMCATFLMMLALPATALAAPVRVMVDAGHGGKDPGAVANGVVEKKVALQISRLVVKSAKRQGWNVAMTRDSDKFIPLEKRPARARAHRADVFVSIHSNSYGPKPKGNMTIYRDGASKRLGHNIMTELDNLTPGSDIGNRKDVRGLAVLRGSSQPAVIVEILSVSAKAEAKALKTPKTQRAAAEAIVRGIAKNEGVKYVPPVKPKPAPAPAAEPTAPVTTEPTQPATPATEPAEGPKTEPTRETAPKVEQETERDSENLVTNGAEKPSATAETVERDAQVRPELNNTAPAARIIQAIVELLTR